MPSSRAQATAGKLSQGKARLAIELVGYEAELTAAMQYVFGNSFVCPVSSQDPGQHKMKALIESTQKCNAWVLLHIRL